MTKQLQVGNDIFEYPFQGDGNWGEEATAWAERVTEALTNVQGPNDILITSATLLNNQSSAVDVSGLVFDTTEVLSVQVDYFIKREGTATSTENGVLYANFDGSTWKLTQEAVGDSGIVFSVTAGGQFQYTSTDFAGHTTSSVRFRARTIDEP